MAFFIKDYQLTDVLSSFLHYGSVKSRRRRMMAYTDDQREQLGEEFASTHKDIGEEWRIFGNLNWRYGQPAKRFITDGLKDGRVETIRKDPAAKALSLKYADDYQFLVALWDSPALNGVRELYASVNGWQWWLTMLSPIVMSYIVFGSWTLTAAMILNGIWASESFGFLSRYEGSDVCGQSVMTYNWKGMWIALSGVWWKLKFKNFFSWNWTALLTFYMAFSSVAEVVVSQIADPTNFSEHNRKNWNTYFNGNLISHTGHLYGAFSGLSMAWFLKKYKWI